MDNDENQLRIYPVWSNFIYYIAGVYSLSIGIYYRKNIERSLLFTIFGILLLLTGTFSILYHVNTPSWTGNPDSIDDPEFQRWLNVDSAFAVTTSVFAIFMLVVRIFRYHCVFIKSKKGIISYPLFYEPNFWFAILFIILSIIFYYLAHGYNTQAISCKGGRCFDTYIDSYDIFHSNWHIFTSTAGLFWITFLNHSYMWNLY